MNAKECDRCHKFYQPTGNYPKFKIAKVMATATRYSKSLDLCPTCEDSLAAWFEEFKNDKSI